MRTWIVFVGFLSTASFVISAQEGTTRIRAATILDGTGKTLRNQTLVIQGSKIISIESPSGAGTYDLGTVTLLPGLIDTHDHIGWHFGKDGRADNRGETPAQQMLYAV